MGVFSKLKGIFYDEVVVDEPENELEKVDKIVKKEKEIEKPKVEKIDFSPVDDIEDEVIKEDKVEKEDTTFSERELFKSERTFNFTEFDDEEPELPVRKNVLEIEKTKATRIEDTRTVVPESQRVFKPSPVISPIYGILDKDYKRDTVVQKTVNEPVYANVTTYDSVRRKAYGTLEDDLEDTLNSMNKLTTDSINEEINNIDDEVDELEKKSAKIEDLINRMEDTADELDKSMSIGDLEDNTYLDNFDDKIEEPVDDKTMTDSTLEHDLFNLIDSMYDDKEE